MKQCQHLFNIKRDTKFKKDIIVGYQDTLYTAVLIIFPEIPATSIVCV